MCETLACPSDSTTAEPYPADPTHARGLKSYRRKRRRLPREHFSGRVLLASEQLASPRDQTCSCSQRLCRCRRRAAANHCSRRFVYDRQRQDRDPPLVAGALLVAAGGALGRLEKMRLAEWREAVGL